MRESLGIALDNHSISTALVDADTPLLGPIDEFLHPWRVDGAVPSAKSSARALASAADAATERASRARLHPRAVGVVCERPDIRDLVPESLSSMKFENVEVVNGLDARLAYLGTVDALAGVSPILAFWEEGSEIVIAAIDPSTGTLDSAHRYDSDELLENSVVFAATLDLIVVERDPAPKMLVAMGTPDETREMSADAAERAALGFLFLGERTPLAIGAALVAATRPISGDTVFLVASGTAGSSVESAASASTSPTVNPRPWAPVVLLTALLLVLGGTLIGLLITLSPDNARTATTDRSNSDHTPPIHAPSSTVDEHSTRNDISPATPNPGNDVADEDRGSVSPRVFEILPPCDPVTPAAPAALRRSDPDLPSTAPRSTVSPTPENTEPCTPTHQG